MADFLQTVYHCRELSAAVLRYCTHGVTEAVQEALSGGDLLLPLADDVSASLVTVAHLVLKDVDVADYPFPTQPTGPGATAAEALQRAVFGAAAQPSLMQTVLCGSLAQARRVLQLCAAVLLDSLAPHNCLAIYGMAASCGCEAVSAPAAAYGLRHFSAAAQLDYAGLTMLRPADLMAFLCSDNLQVASELEAFAALVAWVEYDPAARMAGFARRLAAAVRLPQLTAADLIFIDSHPLVVKDKLALSLVAHTYLSKVAGVACDAPFGLETVARPRRCLAQQRRQQPAQLQAAACGSGPSASPAPEQGAELAAGCEEPGCSTAGGRSALAELVQALAAEAAAAAATPMEVEHTAGPGTPSSVAGDGSQSPGVLEGLLGAPTPAVLRGASASPPLPPQPAAGKARDMLPAGAGTRRSLFCLDACVGAGSSSAGGSSSPGLASRRPGQEGDKARTKSAEPAQLPHLSQQAQRAAAGGLSGLQVEMALSPTRAGIRQWLAGVEGQAPPPEAWLSRKRLRFE